MFKMILFMLAIVLVLSVVYKIISFCTRAILGSILGRLVAIAIFIIIVSLVWKEYAPYFIN
ncbi:hypothetical protein HN170_002595 [Staphylococcus pseudintermedius]|nr:hypothetical protein [Staphylococcus pseudintermedius]EGQ4407683.1 hypothetical protein [Staphylococcus pseudintermedius]